MFGIRGLQFVFFNIVCRRGFVAVIVLYVFARAWSAGSRITCVFTIVRDPRDFQPFAFSRLRVWKTQKLCVAARVLNVFWLCFSSTGSAGSMFGMHAL
jgi:hypothetical protein